MARIKPLLFLLIASWSLILFPVSANAASVDLFCNADGTVGNGSRLFDADMGAQGGACALTGIDHVFSQVICSFVTILNEVLGKMYCGIQYALTDTLSILLTLYVAIFGVQILMGMTQLNSREIMTRLLKIAGVWMFATQSLWGISMVFNFFMDFGGSGIYWALGSIPIGNLTAPGGGPGPTCLGTTNFSGLSSVMPVYAFLDKLLFCAVLAPLAAANVGVIGFFLAMSVIIPPIFMMAIYWLWSILSVLARGLISFMMGISALAFLIALSPIFLSLMLFRPTYQFFENWLKYMISYSLQIVIVFACIALWLTTVPLIIGFFNELSGIVYQANKANSTAVTTNTTENWGICPYDVTTVAGRPKIACSDPQFNQRLNNPMPNPGAYPFDGTANEKQAWQLRFSNWIDYERVRASLIPLARLTKSEGNTVGVGDVCADLQRTCRYEECGVISLYCTAGSAPGGTRDLGKLLEYVIFHLISLIIISYAFDALLKASPQIATQLAGPEYMFNLGAGFGAGGFGSTGKGATQRLRTVNTQQGGNTMDTLRDMGVINNRNAGGQYRDNIGTLAGTRD